MVEMIRNFEIRKTASADVQKNGEPGCWHLLISPGEKGIYRLAQVGDDTGFSRDCLRWDQPVTLNLRARASAADIQGTWGFGFWNDPFSLSLGFGGGSRRFPTLPNAAWFFFASPQNHLSFRNNLPANGFIAQTFQSPKIPTYLMSLGALGLPLLLWTWLARRIRSSIRYLIAEDSFHLNIDVTQWHPYTLEWGMDQVVFKAGDRTFKTGIVPKGPLGFLIWIDNQYASFPPSGKLSYGTLTTSQPSWLEIKELSLINA